MKRPFVYSTLLHILILLYISMGNGLTGGDSTNQTGRGNGKGGEGQGSTLGKNYNKDIIPIQLKMEPQISVSKEKDKNGIKQVKKENKCEKWYGGVGITHNPDDSIEKVHAGYPAARSGCVEAGDYIVAVKSKNGLVVGDVGEKITLILVRGGVRLSCSIVRERICYKDM